MKSKTTQILRYAIADSIAKNTFTTSANTYVAIGRPVRWGNDNTELDSEIETIVLSTNYRNQVFRDMVAMKKIGNQDLSLVVPRVDWATATKYDVYTDSQDMFSYQSLKNIGNATANVADNEVEANGAVYTGNISVGTIIQIGEDIREVVSVNLTSNIATVNTNFSQTHSNSLITISNTYPKFANTFYVRNSKDQVFKCLYANNNSTVEPEITVGGNLPESVYIETSDGYKWKYLYTIPYGLKQKFFTETWMPITDEALVTGAAIDGSIDIINILDGGDGYYLAGESGNSNSLPIITVSGDGTAANVTAKIQSGVITDLNILNRGSGYTKATITINDPDKVVGSNVASFDIVFSPNGGHGSSVARELGCYSMMTCVSFVDDEDGKIPVGSDAYPFDFRQISIIRNPKSANGVYAANSVYRTTTKVQVTNPGESDYLNDEIVYVGTSLATASYNATMVYWDSSNNIMYLNNTDGTLGVGQLLRGANSSLISTVLSIESPENKTYSGDLLYVENRQKIVRDTNQTEQVKIVLSF